LPPRPTPITIKKAGFKININKYFKYFTEGNYKL
jgi:hypothetical protein